MAIPKYLLTENQLEWLNQHGGRDEKHVEKWNGTLVVWFGHYEKGSEIVELPDI